MEITGYNLARSDNPSNKKRGNTDLIRRAVDLFDWDRAFANADVNKNVFILNKAILNVLSNFIPHETLMTNTPLGLQKNKNSHPREK